MDYEQGKHKFIEAWGTLGSSWGINRTMAQIHALLLLSTESLTTEEVMEQLSISRGNANMNIRALIDWGLVSKELRVGERKEYFKAGKDIWEAARQIARERRKREIEPIFKMLKELESVEDKNKELEVAELKIVLGDLQNFTSKADSVLDKFGKSDEHWFYKTLIGLMK